MLALWWVVLPIPLPDAGEGTSTEECLTPDYADVHARLAELLLARGAGGEARSHAEAALRLQPNRRTLIDLLTRASNAGEGRR
jgi:hypothetical protein